MSRKILAILFPILAAIAGVIFFFQISKAANNSVQPMAASTALEPLGSAITYQGYLESGGVPVEGICDFQMSLFGSETGSEDQVGTTQVFTEVLVTGGTFTINDLDFGPTAFDGGSRYLEIAVACPAGSGTYETLSPRQAVTATPYALYATKAPWLGLDGIPAGFEDGIDDDTTYQAGTGLELVGATFALSPTFQLPQTCDPDQIIAWDGTGWTCADDQTSGEGAGWLLTGNTGTTPGTNYLGTNDNTALELKVDSSRALRIEPGVSSPNIIAGYYGNNVGSEVEGGTIGGGGRDQVINQVGADFGTVSGGAGNTAGGYAASVGGGEANSAANNYSTVAGGSGNQVEGAYTIIGGGQGNSTNATHGTVGGGGFNSVTAPFGTVGGGASNSVTGTYGTASGGLDNGVLGPYGAVGGGWYNYVFGDYGTIAGGGPSDPGNPSTSNNRTWDDYGTVSGGGGNTAGDGDSDPDSAPGATVGGGLDNTAGSSYATVAGGYSNTAESYAASVSGGTNNAASDSGATVGGGSGNTASNNYAVVAGGYSNAASGVYATNSGGWFNQVTGNFGAIPGGIQNYVGGNYGFAAGYGARAEHQGAFVWSGSSEAFTSTAVNQFLVDASGGVGIGTNAPSHMLTVSGDASIQSSEVISVGGITNYTRTVQAPRSLYAVGDLLYATGYATNTLSIWNMTDPTAQDLLGYTTFQIQGPSDLQVVGDRAYIASRNNDSLVVLDVSDPTDIRHIGDTNQYLGRPVGVHVSGKYAYIASEGRDTPGETYDGLAVVDLTDLPAEMVTTSYITTDLQLTSDVFVSGGLAYVTSRDNPQDGNGRLVVFDVSNPQNIRSLSYTQEPLIEPVKVHVDGIYAFVVDKGLDSLVIFNISDPAQITFQSEVTTTLINPISLYVSGDRAYIAYTGDAVTGDHCGLAVLDISDPTAVSVLNELDMSDVLKWIKTGTVEDPIWEQVPPYPRAITGSGDRIYLGAEWHDSVYVFEIDNLEVSALHAGEVQAAHLEVEVDAAIQGDLGVRGGLQVGPGGALIQGALSVDSAANSFIGGRLAIGPAVTEITKTISITEYAYYYLYHPSHALDVNGEARVRVNDHNHLVFRSNNTAGDEDAYLDFVDLDYPDTFTPTARIAFDAADPFTHTTVIRFSTQGPDDAEMVERIHIDENGLQPSDAGAYDFGDENIPWRGIYAQDYFTPSDARFKENIHSLGGGLAAVTALRPVTFNWAGQLDEGQHYGLIAQEVREVLPDVVSGEGGDGGMLTLNYNALVPVLVDAIQEQQAEIESQEAVIAGLEARLSALENQGRAKSSPNLNWLGAGLLVLGTVLVTRRRKG